MILFEGKLYEDDALDTVLDRLWDSCVKAVENRESMVEKVLSACEGVAGKIKSGEYDEIIRPLLQSGLFSQAQMAEALAFFDRDNLQKKYDAELGVLQRNMPKGKRLEPLGILFHIAAGNAEALPFYSVLEGLLAGNVNLLKLPSADDGLSLRILYEMVQAEPDLAPYVCVMDIPSTNLKVMKQLGDMADGIAVWGGDAAITAVRAMADPATQIISWGHKLSFAYATPELFDGAWEHEEMLRGLAQHICETDQLLCSSCQGIFVDSEDMEVVTAAGEKILKILEEVNGTFSPQSVGVRGKMSISLYNEQLEAQDTGRKVLRGVGVSVIVARDSELELSYQFRNCWVKPLPRQNIVKALKGKRGYLQTVGLLCEEQERDELTNRLIKAGVTRVAGSADMSYMVPEGTHDGEYALRRYSKIVEF